MSAKSEVILYAPTRNELYVVAATIAQAKAFVRKPGIVFVIVGVL